jgi:hypothetical protein
MIVILNTLLALTLPAFAQEPTPFTLDTVLVVPFEASNAELNEESLRVHSIIEARFADQFIIVAMDDVKTMDAGYSPKLYMEACPPGQHTGCSSVVGGHANVEWVVTGRLVEDGEGHGVQVAFIDIPNSKVVLEFSASLDGTNDLVFADGVANVLDKVISGAGQDQDIRGDLDEPDAQRQLDAAQDAMVAAGLTELEDSLGHLEANLDVEFEAPKVSREKLAELEGREDGAPWIRLNMGKEEYRRYRNSGKSLTTWRKMANGRFTQITARVAFGGGTGPYGQYFDGRYVLDDEDLEVIEVNRFQEVLPRAAFGVDMELGFGIHPWIDVGGAFAIRSGTFSYLFHQEVQNTPSDQIVIKEPEQATASTMMFGGRVTIAPLPTFGARPFLTTGIMYWQGTAVTSLVAPPEAIISPPADMELGALFKPNTALLLQLMPGGELSFGNGPVNLFVRGVVNIPLGGATVREDHGGAGALDTTPTPARAFAAGVGGQGGLLIRLGPLKKFAEDNDDFGDDMFFEEEDF